MKNNDFLNNSFKGHNSLLLAFCWLIFSHCGGGSSSATSAYLDPIYSDDFNLVVTGAASSEDDCTVTGSGGRRLGAGSPAAITYNTGLERASVVHCGDLSAVFSIADDTVALSESSTTIADLLEDSSLTQGVSLLVSLLQDIQGNMDLSASVLADESADANAEVSDSLVTFLTARDDYSKGKQSTTEVKNEIITLLINSGEPVVIENIGKEGTIAACSDEAVSVYSKYALAVDASVVGREGCLVYHSLDAVTDLNNPYGAPAGNVPASFRTMASESGVVAQLVEAYSDDRSFSVEEIQALLVNSLGYTAYTEDDEGVFTDADISVSDLNTFFTTLYEKSIDSLDELKEFRFHTGYNPSGGWEVNIAAEKQSLPAECVDSDRDTSCAVEPLRFDFDGTTLTQNAEGSYLLEMQYRDSAFQDYGYVLSRESGRPYRDVNYQPVQVTIVADDYSAIDYANPLYDAELDPMNDGEGNSAPFSNSDFRALYPEMNLVDNAYLFGNPEVAARLMILMDINPKLEELTALQAYSLIKMITKGLAALPVEGGSDHFIISDYGKTVGEWESLVSEWLNAGGVVVRLEAVGKMQIKKDELELQSAECRMGELEVKCSLGGTLIIDPANPSVSETGTEFTLSGELTVTSDGFDAVSYAPTTLKISSDGTYAQALGDSHFSFSFSSKGLVEKIQANSTINAAYSLTAYHP